MLRATRHWRRPHFSMKYMMLRNGNRIFLPSASTHAQMVWQSAWMSIYTQAHTLKRECMSRIPYYCQRGKKISHALGGKKHKTIYINKNLAFLIHSLILPSMGLTRQIRCGKAFTSSRSQYTATFFQNIVKPGHSKFNWILLISETCP